VGWSGGAEAITTAYSELTPAQKSRIANILYLAPGAVGPIQSNGDNYNIVLGNDPTDVAANFLTQFPPGSEANTAGSNCLHTDFACLETAALNAGYLTAAEQSGPCNTPMTFGLGMAPARISGLGGGGGGNGGGNGAGKGRATSWLSQWWWYEGALDLQYAEQ
jgi:hypothetical protein